MKYNIYFDISGILLTAMLILIIHMRRAYPTKTVGMYKTLLWLNLAASCADLFSAVIISFPSQYPMALNYLVNIVYLTTHNLTAIVFLLYVMLIIRGNYGMRAEQIFWRSVLIFELAAIFTTPFTGFIFCFDEGLQYTHGPLMPVLYVCAVVVMLYSLALFLRHRAEMKKYQTVTNAAFLFLIIGAVVFQSFFPNMLIESFCTAVALLMMNVSLDNPEIYFYPNSDCFNQVAFDDMLTRRLSSRAEFTILAFTYDDLSVLRSRLGSAAFDVLTERTVTDCHRLFGQRRVYLLSNTSIAIDLGGGDEYIAMERLAETVGQNVEIEQRWYDFQPHFCVLKHPGVVSTVVDANDAITDALYGTFQKTGQRVIRISPALLDAKRRESSIIHVLRAAIASDGFDVFYQPIYHQPTGRYRSAEALVRLRRGPDDPFIGPDEFIPIAEKNGLILEIGEIVFRKVCAFWRDADLSARGLEYIEVNLSRLQLLDMASVRRLEEICAEYGLAPENFNLEITETAYVSEEERETVNRCIEYLCGRGFAFSLDDYGSGYATASYFAEMPFRIVKIDKSILWKAMEQKNFRAVLENSISLVRAFGRECVAEGVETREMADLLTSLGCDFFQGYLYSRPIPEGDFTDFLSNAPTPP